MSTLIVNELSLNYFGHADSLHSIDHTFEEGINCVFAEQGQGKTSLLKAIAGLVEFHDGSVTLDGGSVVYGKRTEIIMVFDDLGLFEKRSALYNLRYPLKLRGLSDEETDATIRKWLDVFQISDVALATKAFRLSPEYRARIALARAFMRESKVLLLDDPLKDLAPTDRRKLFLELLILMRSRKGVVVYATDDWQEISALNAPTLILSYGYAMESGIPAEIAKTPRCLSTCKNVLPYYNSFPVKIYDGLAELFGTRVDILPEKLKPVYEGKELFVGFPFDAFSSVGLEIEGELAFVCELDTVYGKVYVYDLSGERIYSDKALDTFRIDPTKLGFYDGVTEFLVNGEK